MTTDLKVSIQFLAELEELRAAVPQIKAVFQQLLGVSKDVGEQASKSAKTAGAALTDQLATPAKKAASEIKALAQEEQKAAAGAKDVAKAAKEVASEADKAAGSAAKAGKALKAMGEDGKSGAAGATQAIKESSGHTDDFGSHLGALAQKLGLAYAGLLLFRQGLAFVKEGIGYGSQMETAQLGIGSLIAAQGKLTDSTGRELVGREALNAAMDLSSDQMQKLKIAGLETVATTEQLVVAFQQAVGVGLSVGMNLDQIREVTIKITQAAAALGLPMNQLAEEVRDLLQGNINPKNTRIATALNITNEEVRKWKAAGGSTLADELNKRMEAFGLAGDMAAKTWQGVTSNVIEATQTLAGEMTKPLFVQLRDGLQAVLEQVFDLKNARISEAFTGLVGLGQEGFGALGSLAQKALFSILDGLKSVSAWVTSNRDDLNRYIAVLSTLAQVVGTILAGAFSALGTALGWVVNLMGSFPATVSSLVGVLVGLAVANALVAVSFTSIAASATAAAMAITSFFASLGPIGWTIIAIGALAGAALGLRAARQAEQQEALAAASRQRQEEQTTKVLVERYEALSAELAKGNLTLAGRIKAEKELEEVRGALIKLGGAYAQIVQEENGSRANTIQRLKEETSERERANNARRVEMALMANLIQADIQQQKKRVALMDQGRMPDTGVAMSAAQKAWAATEGYAREVNALKGLQEAYAQTKAIIDGLGPSTETHNLTIAQIKERKAELVKLIDETTKAQDKALTGVGDQAATKAYEARKEALKGWRSELEDLRRAVPDVVTVKARKATPDEDKAKLAHLEAVARLAKLEADAAERTTLAQEKEAKLLAWKAEFAEKTAQLAKDKEKATTPQAKADVAAEANALKKLNDTKIKQIDEEYIKKREALEADLQARLDAQEEGGLAKRQETIRKYFKALRADNDKAMLDGKPFLAADQILSAEQEAMARERIKQVREDLAKIKQEMATKAQELGRGITDQEKLDILKPHVDAGGTRAEAAGQKSKEDHLGDTGTNGILSGVDGWLAASQNAFAQWKGFATNILGGTQTAFSGFFSSILQHGMTAGEKWNALWQGLSSSVVKALSDMAAQELIHWGLLKAKALWNAVSTGQQVTQSGIKVAANTAEGNSSIFAAAAGFFKAHSWIPFVGLGIAIAMIASMTGLLNGITGRKVGGLVGQNGPELTMLGEGGELEVVAPEHDFKDWARGLVGMGANLQANIASQQGQARSYQEQGTSYAQNASQSQRGDASGSGAPFGFLYADLRGAVIAGESSESRRIIGKLIRDVQDDDNRRNN